MGSGPRLVTLSQEVEFTDVWAFESSRWHERHNGWFHRDCRDREKGDQSRWRGLEDGAFTEPVHAEVEGDVDFLRDGVRVLAQELMEMRLHSMLAPGGTKRGAERTGERNGYRDRSWGHACDSIELRVPTCTRRRLLPALLEPRRRGERALVAVVQEAYVRA